MIRVEGGIYGIRVNEIDSLYDDEKNTVRLTESILLAERYDCGGLCELITADDAEVLGTYGSDFYHDTPALTRHAYGQGEAYYIAAQMSRIFAEDMTALLVERAGLNIPGFSIPEGIACARRYSDAMEYLFVQNFARETISLSVPEDYELLWGEEGNAYTPFSGRVFRRRIREV